MPTKPQKQSIARALGVSPQRVTALIKMGMPIDSVPAARVWYQENIQPRSKPSAQHEAADPGDDTLQSAKLREARARAIKAEMDNAQRLGQLVDKAGVERAAYQFGRILQKTLVDVMPSKVAMELATMTDPWTIECYLREQVRNELAAVSKMTTEEVENA